VNISHLFCEIFTPKAFLVAPQLTVVSKERG
jgi:hypothetical protein